MLFSDEYNIIPATTTRKAYSLMENIQKTLKSAVTNIFSLTLQKHSEIGRARINNEATFTRSGTVPIALYFFKY